MNGPRRLKGEVVGVLGDRWRTRSSANLDDSELGGKVIVTGAIGGEEGLMNTTGLLDKMVLCR